MSISDNVIRMDHFLFDLYKPRLQEHFKYHPNGEYLINQMRDGELSAEEIDSAFEAAESYMAQEVFQNIDQSKGVVVEFARYRAQ